MTNRIDQKFTDLKKLAKPAFMPFAVGGYPDFQTSLKIIKTLCQTADLLEIGFPYSDPLADGPTVQAADMRALRAGATTDSVFRLISEVRKSRQTPITVLVYANLILRRGLEKFYRAAAACGVDGVLIPDVPAEEIGPFAEAAVRNNIHQIFLVTQMTDNRRLNKILKHAKGFLYLVSVLGVTGAREKFGSLTDNFIRRVKKQTRLPLCVGFGVSTPKQFLEMIKDGADGVIVGSALIDVIAKNFGKINMLEKIRYFLAKFKTP